MAHRGRPGHETNLPLVWVVADLAAPNWPGYPGVVDRPRSPPPGMR
jgi:hypothetical protein